VSLVNPHKPLIVNEIRPVLESELDLLREISIKTFVTAFGAQNTDADMELYLEESRNMEQVIKEFNDPDVTLLFTHQGDLVTGYMKINQGEAQTEKFDQTSLELERIYILEPHQNQGIGKLMMDHFRSMGRALEVEMLWLGVWEHNPRAMAFYEREGYEVFGEHDYLLGTDLQRDLLYRKML